MANTFGKPAVIDTAMTSAFPSDGGHIVLKQVYVKGHSGSDDLVILDREGKTILNTRPGSSDVLPLYLLADSQVNGFRVSTLPGASSTVFVFWE